MDLLYFYTAFVPLKGCLYSEETWKWQVVSVCLSLSLEQRAGIVIHHYKKILAFWAQSSSPAW